jgi:hypothetical protein
MTPAQHAHIARLLHNVLWPAVAGNVLWSLLQVASTANSVNNLVSLSPELLALLFIGLYFCIDWIDSENASLKTTYWRADLPLATAIAVFAVAIQADKWWSVIALILAFISAIIGHLAGAWDQTQEKSPKPSRRAFAAINSLGIIVAVVGALYDRVLVWPQALAIAIVVLAFLYLRPRILAKWPTELVQDSSTASEVTPIRSPTAV